MELNENPLTMPSGLDASYICFSVLARLKASAPGGRPHYEQYAYEVMHTAGRIELLGAEIVRRWAPQYGHDAPYYPGDGGLGFPSTHQPSSTMPLPQPVQPLGRAPRTVAEMFSGEPVPDLAAMMRAAIAPTPSPEPEAKPPETRAALPMIREPLTPAQAAALLFTTPAVEPEPPAADPESPAAEPGLSAAEPGLSAAEPDLPAAEPDLPAAEPDPPAAEPDLPAAEPPAAEPEPPAAEPPAAEPEPPVAEPEPPAAEPEPLGPTVAAGTVGTLASMTMKRTEAAAAAGTAPHEMDGNPALARLYDAFFAAIIGAHDTAAAVTAVVEKQPQLFFRMQRFYVSAAFIVAFHKRRTGEDILLKTVENFLRETFAATRVDLRRAKAPVDAKAFPRPEDGPPPTFAWVIYFRDLKPVWLAFRPRMEFSSADVRDGMRGMHATRGVYQRFNALYKTINELETLDYSGHFRFCPKNGMFVPADRASAE